MAAFRGVAVGTAVARTGGLVGLGAIVGVDGTGVAFGGTRVGVAGTGVGVGGTGVADGGRTGLAGAAVATGFGLAVTVARGTMGDVGAALV